MRPVPLTRPALVKADVVDRREAGFCRRISPLALVVTAPLEVCTPPSSTSSPVTLELELDTVLPGVRTTVSPRGPFVPIVIIERKSSVPALKLRTLPGWRASPVTDTVPPSTLTVPAAPRVSRPLDTVPPGPTLTVPPPPPVPTLSVLEVQV